MTRYINFQRILKMSSDTPNKKNNQLTQWEQGVPLSDLHQDLTNLAEKITKTFKKSTLAPFGLSSQAAFSPKVDVKEEVDFVVATAELPGMTEKDVEVLVTDETLTLRGEKKSEVTTQNKKFYRIESSYGSFERHLSLPCDVESDRAEAVFKNGILTVTMPKSESSKKNEKKLTIKSA